MSSPLQTECAVHDIWRRSPGHMRLAINHWLAAPEATAKAVLTGPGRGRPGHGVDLQFRAGSATLSPDGTFSISDTSGG